MRQQEISSEEVEKEFELFEDVLDNELEIKTTLKRAVNVCNELEQKIVNHVSALYDVRYSLLYDEDKDKIVVEQFIYDKSENVIYKITSEEDRILVEDGQLILKTPLRTSVTLSKYDEGFEELKNFIKANYYKSKDNKFLAKATLIEMKQIIPSFEPLLDLDDVNVTLTLWRKSSYNNKEFISINTCIDYNCDYKIKITIDEEDNYEAYNRLKNFIAIRYIEENYEGLRESLKYYEMHTKESRNLLEEYLQSGGVVKVETDEEKLELTKDKVIVKNKETNEVSEVTKEQQDYEKLKEHVYEKLYEIEEYDTYYVLKKALVYKEEEVIAKPYYLVFFSH